MLHLLRRKIVILFVCAVCLSSSSYAQLRKVINLQDYDYKKIHFGINLGFNKAHFNFTQHPLFLNQDSVMVVESLNSTGINLAWLVNFNLSEHFDIRTFPLNLTFSEKAFQYALKYPDPFSDEDSITQKKVQSITLSLPIQLHFASDRINNFRVYTIAGVRFDYDMAANAGKQNGDDLIKLRKFDYSAEAGIGFHFYFPYFVLSPELKVSWGFNNLHSRNPALKFSNVVDKINSRMIQLSFTVE